MSPHLPESNNRELPQVHADVTALLKDAAMKLRTILRDDFMMTDTPLEVQDVMGSAIEILDTALHQLAGAERKPTATPFPGGPTRQQGQFLAFIHEYIMRNEFGVPPSHADFQRFFNLTPHR